MAISDKSSWREEAPRAKFPPLEADITVDVAIVGGGLTGITAAYLLRTSGKSVALLEGGRIGGRATGATTAFLMELLDTPASKLISRFGADTARRIAQAHRDAITHMEDTAARELIDCEFMRCPAYVYARTDGQTKELQREIAALKSVGTAASYDASAEALGFSTKGHIRVENQAKFHPLKYLFALAEVCGKTGVHLFEQTEVAQVLEGTPNILRTKNGPTVRATHVLIATHYPLDPQPAKLRGVKSWYTTYVLEAFLPKGLLPEGLYEDLETPYHYARIDGQEGRDRLILGGADHPSEVSVDLEKSFGALEAYVKELLPGTAYELTRKWRGRVVEPVDGLAFIGPAGNSTVFHATGFSGNGMTYATLAAEMFRDHVGSAANPYQAIFAADRPLPSVNPFRKFLGRIFGSKY